MDWRFGLGAGCEDLERGRGCGLEAWTGGVAFGRCLGARTRGVEAWNGCEDFGRSLMALTGDVAWTWSEGETRRRDLEVWPLSLA